MRDKETVKQAAAKRKPLGGTSSRPGAARTKLSRAAASRKLAANPAARENAEGPASRDAAGPAAGRLEQGAAELRRRVDELTAELSASNQALREVEERLIALKKNAADAIITIHQDGIIESFNPAAERMFGYTAAEAIGQNIRLIMPAPYADEHDGYMARYLATGVSRVMGRGRELTGQRKSGAVFPIDIVISEVREGSRQTFTGIIRDISERKELQKQVLHIAEEEQRRIGQELHDRTQQELSGLGMMAHGLFESLANRSLPESEMAARLSEGIGRSLDNVRKLSRGLVPAEVKAHGLALALDDLVRRTTELHHPVACTLVWDAPVELKDDTVATHLYRIAQEAITNALKHAQASQIKLVLSSEHGQITLQVLDNGRGIDLACTANRGIGLQVMSYRAGLIGGSLRIRQSPQGGAAVICKAPAS